MRGFSGSYTMPVQHLYPLELSCDRTVVKPAITLNADVREFIPKRAAATAARDRIVAITDTEKRLEEH